ncbi:hypothetical protein LTR09_011581 [Extremus antarcticus]|uniref:Uncharacterized protein n=1 Tax=Extremus antarcticus TaxID=702011 RepID=A0AAJ0D664_9PEZI|nr:hypothetical protein LTR09_011581 [Extremus antarcticus]
MAEKKESYLDLANMHTTDPAYDDRKPRTSSHAFTEPRENHFYRFEANTTTRPSTDGGIHTILDDQDILETLIYPEGQIEKAIERKVNVT